MNREKATGLWPGVENVRHACIERSPRLLDCALDARCSFASSRWPWPPPCTGAAPGDVGVAVVRPDGRLQPLAGLEGDNWTPLAPADAAGDWSLWLFDDPVVKASPFAARSARPITAAAAPAACVPVSGLDAAATPPATGTTTVPSRLGLALRGTDVRPDLPVVVAADSELGRQLTTRAAAAFHRAEDETLTLEVEELPAGFPRFADRRQRPVTWTLIVRQGLAQGATKTYYLEGQKDYEGFRGRTDIGRIRTTGHVFVQMTGGRETIDAEVDLSDVDGPPVDVPDAARDRRLAGAVGVAVRDARARRRASRDRGADPGDQPAPLGLAGTGRLRDEAIDERRAHERWRRSAVLCAARRPRAPSAQPGRRPRPSIARQGAGAAHRAEPARERRAVLVPALRRHASTAATPSTTARRARRSAAASR